MSNRLFPLSLYGADGVTTLGNQDSLTPFMGLGPAPFSLPWGGGKQNVVLPIWPVFCWKCSWGGGRLNVVLPILIVFAGGVFVSCLGEEVDLMSSSPSCQFLLEVFLYHLQARGIVLGFI